MRKQNIHLNRMNVDLKCQLTKTNESQAEMSAKDIRMFKTCNK